MDKAEVKILRKIALVLYCALGFAAVIALFVPAVKAQMQLQCRPRQAVTTALKMQDKEAASLAITGQQWLLEIWKDQSGRWDAFLIDPADPSFMCHVFSGSDWADAEKPSY